MSTQPRSRWVDDEETAALDARRKQEKEAKKKAKFEKQQRLEREAAAAKQADHSKRQDDDRERATKRRRLSDTGSELQSEDQKPPRKLLRFPAPGWGPCRHVDNFEKLNHIEEGSYGWVSRAREEATGEVVTLKKLKMEGSNDGFPVTGLREIQTLMASRHENIVALREVVMGDTAQEYVIGADYIRDFEC